MAQTLANRNNNPGNLKDPSTGTFRQFNSPEEGRAALYNDLTAKMTGKSTTGIGPDSSLVDFANIYAPSSDKNNPIQYAANLANHLKVSPDTKIGSLQSRIDEFADAVSKNEGYASDTPTKNSGISIPQSIIPQANAQTVDTGNQNQTDNTPKQDLLSKSADVVSSIFPGKQIGKAIGTLGGYIATKGSDLIHGTDYAKNYPYAQDFPSPKQLLGDAVQTALTIFAPEAGKGVSTLGKLGITSAIGAGLGASNAAANNQSIKSGAMIGGSLGAGGSLFSSLAGKLSSYLPASFVQKALGGAEKDVANTLLKNSEKWTLGGALQEANQNITKHGNEVNSILKNLPQERQLGSGNDAIKDALLRFNQAGLTPDLVVKNLKSYAPEVSTLVDKLSKGTANLTEKNQLRQYLDKPYTTLDPESTWKKKLAKTVADSLRGEIQSWAPDTQIPFKEMSKNFTLRDALEPAVEKSGKGKGLGLYDITAFLAGNSAGGPAAGLASVGAERVLRAPNANFVAAKALNKGSGFLGDVSRGLKAPVIGSVTNRTQSK